MTGQTVPLWHWEDPVGTLSDCVRRGGLLGIPTGSSYGLGVDPENRQAVDSVFDVKGRAAEKALPVVLGDLEQLRSLGGDPDAPALKRLARAWPGPLTVVVPVREGLPAASGATLAVRIPGHERLRRLLQELGRPLTATSANRSGEPPVLEPSGLQELLRGRDAMIVDDGLLEGGAPSTIVRLEGDRFTLLRRGRYPLSRLRKIPGFSERSETFSAAIAEKPVEESGRH